MSYIGLGSRGPVAAAADATGLNPGNLTTSFTPAVINCNVSFFEIYHMVISGVPIGASATVLLNNKPWGFTYPNQGSEWDPTQPMELNPTDELDFLWSTNSGSPLVTIWLRYDPLIQPFAKSTIGTA